MADSPQPFALRTEEHRDGVFVRQGSRFRSWVTDDGRSGFAPEAGRYHLYVARACPWAHRTIIGRRLMGLENVISISFVDPIRDERGWAFSQPGRYEDPVNGFRFLSEAYREADAGFADRVTVPVLWDRQQRTIVNNESADILRMLSTVFAPLAKHPVVLCPAAQAAEIDALNEHIYTHVNNGVYMAGFSTRQSVYELAVSRLFGVLDELEARLGSSRFLLGPAPLETDWRLFTTLIRFDAVYQIHFKCSVRKVAEYANLWPYLRDLYQWPGISETVSFDEIRAHYYGTHGSINPTGIRAVMPALDFEAPADRDRF
ncbi:MAG TPA: glutathione S-transferase C-terminal domain-containing protein [Solirubrobacteraceae bacterium]|jgi:putative glutathione S-transferase|nr:glutathione S-transferase C-terminal domain-containing protein [Solirubrobacteraceae bacterium]